RRMIGREAVWREVLENALLGVGLANGTLGANRVSNELESHVIGRARVDCCFQVHGPLLVVPTSLSELDIIFPWGDVRSTRAYELDRARVDARHVGIGVPRHVLHRDLLSALHETGDAGFQLLPAEIDLLWARQVIEGVRLDAVNQLAWLAFGRDEVE